MHRASRNEVLHIRQRHGSDSFSLQRNPKVVANIDGILCPFLPTASAVVRQMQNPMSIVLPSQAQPIRHIERVSGRRKLVGHCRHGFVFARENETVKAVADKFSSPPYTL